MSERGSLKVLADPEIFLFFLKISYMFAPEIFSNKRASKLWIGVWKCSVGIFFQSWLQCFLFYIIAKKVYQMWIFKKCSMFLFRSSPQFNQVSISVKSIHTYIIPSKVPTFQKFRYYVKYMRSQPGRHCPNGHNKSTYR